MTSKATPYIMKRFKYLKLREVFTPIQTIRRDEIFTPYSRIPPIGRSASLSTPRFENLIKTNITNLEEWKSDSRHQSQKVNKSANKREDISGDKHNNKSDSSETNTKFGLRRTNTYVVLHPKVTHAQYEVQN